MYAPKNGPPYTAEFVARYRQAQEARDHRVTAWVKAELQRLNALQVYDRLINVSRVWADLRLMDDTLDPSDRKVGVC